MQLPQFQAHAALEESHWWFLGRRHIIRDLLRTLLPPSQKISLVDVGCGTGGLTAFLSKEYTCIGIDPSSDGIAFARSRFPSSTFIHGYAPENIADTFQKADGILLIEVLEHVKEDVSFVHELITHMKPGAILLIMAPADMSLWGPHDVAFEHERRYDKERLRATWKGERVEELLVSFCNSRLYPLVRLMRVLSRWKGHAWGEGGTDIALPSRPLNALLRWIFQGESQRLVQALKNRHGGYSRGVTLIAVLRKK